MKKSKVTSTRTVSAPAPVKRPRAVVRNRAPGPTTNATTPGKAGSLVAKANKWRAAYNALRGLTMDRVVALLEAGERGQLADLQWAFRFAEKRNATCRALIQRRTAALLKLDWDIKVVDQLPPGATEAMAAAQQATLRTWYERIDNLRDAMRHLALAEFRGYSHLQLQTEGGTAAGWDAVRQVPGRIILRPLAQWHWVRDGLEEGWGWNPDASTRGWEGIAPEHRADPRAWGLIIRECPMPLDELALVIHLRKALSQKDWDAFVEIYGIPGGVVIMPPGAAGGDAPAYEAAAAAVAEGGSGALPAGSEYTPNDGPRGTNPFSDHLRYQDQELVLAGTGGMLTMLAEAGSGTLAGGAHKDAFDDLAEGEAAEISEMMQRQFDRVILELEHPGEPECAYWELAAEPDEDTDKLVDRMVKLHGIGFRVSKEEASERTGLHLESAPEPTPPTAGPAPGLPAKPMANASRPGLLDQGARQLAAGVQADLAPLLRRLAAIEGITDPEIRRARLEALVAEWDDRAEDILADPEAAQALARVMGTATANGLAGQKPIMNGEQDGHPFRGNQHTGWQGGSPEIAQLVEEAMGSHDAAGRVVSYQAVSADEAARVKEKTGLDVTGYTHAVDGYAVRHIMGQHAAPGRESPRGQVALTREDLARLPEVISSPDTIEHAGKTKIGREAIRYTKRMGDETVVIEEVRTKKKLLVPVTMYKRRGATSDVRNRTPSHTSETLRPDEVITHRRR